VSPGRLDPAVIADRVSWIRTMLMGIRELPLDSFEEFTADRHRVAAAESYLRRAIEALVDLGRHILAKRFAVAVSDYKAIPGALVDAGVLEREFAPLFAKICGYRNRLVHFYHIVSDQELFTICSQHAGDIEDLLTTLLDWVAANPDQGHGADLEDSAQ
jgi:uncharacterized protein YutE (UPF0331/DUF86 family)